MTRVGIVGIGFMGMVHYLSYKKLAGAEVVALCEQEEKRLAGDWTDIRGNFGPQGEQMDLSGIATSTSVEDLIANPDVDLVDITLPPALHADFAVKALEAGKHVFCEKPMALNVTDCDRMLAAAEASGRQLLIGHVLPFFPEYAWALRAIESGQHGRLLGGSFARVISNPTWLNNFWVADQVGGPMLDLHVHDAPLHSPSVRHADQGDDPRLAAERAAETLALALRVCRRECRRARHQRRDRPAGSPLSARLRNPTGKCDFSF